MIRKITIIFLLSVMAGGCDDGGGSPDASMDAGPDAASDGDAAPDGATDEVPEWELGVDDDYEVEGLRGTYLIGNALTPGDDQLELVVTAPSGTEAIEAWIDDEPRGPLEPEGDEFLLDASIADLGPGTHTVVLALEGEDRAFAALEFIRSHPLYVVVTNDWDDPDNADANFVRQEELHQWHPELRLTHFVGPYTFTDPGMSVERIEFIVDWLIGMRDDYGDEIGLHIHPYCSFVEAAGLECRTERSFAYADGDETGYTIYLGEYDEDETVQLLETANELFTDNGLPEPTSFRAGGWTAELHTLRALVRAGHLADTSALNWSLIEEWEGVPGTELFDWNRDQWSSIDETSQPYYPSESDILSAEPPNIPILEVPDNAALVDYVVSAEMVDIFEGLLDDGALAEPRQLSIGYHPPNFSSSFQTRIHNALTDIEPYLASGGDGPVVYATLSELALVWPLEEP